MLEKIIIGTVPAIITFLVTLFVTRIVERKKNIEVIHALEQKNTQTAFETYQMALESNKSEIIRLNKSIESLYKEKDLCGERIVALEDKINQLYYYSCMDINCKDKKSINNTTIIN